ncbi:MAG: iron-containing alcohol dehydrogenase [Firmicutes bacterium]|nr:iron-containing alcohol dehydrogenase [Bacillota bacterium]
MNPLRKFYCRAYQTVFRIALPLLPYREPEILHSTDELPALLRAKGISRVLAVTDTGIYALHLTEPMERALREAGIACTLYHDVTPNPTITQVEQARSLYLQCGAQALIAFGGGSSMDCAKAAGARIVKPRQSISRMRGILKVGRRLPLLIAVPTTAGTGSEVTLAAVITDPQSHHKYPINDFCLIPRYAVHDPSVTVGLPGSVTATTGMDALTHAVEAYIGRSTTRHTRAMAEEAATLIYANLYRAYENGGDLQARANMLRAAYCAGIAFTQSYVGYIHALAHALGGRYGVPHGLANAVILPIFLEEYGAAIHGRLGALAKICGAAAESDSDAEASGKMIAWIRRMNERMGIPRYISGIRAQDIPEMAKFADMEANPLYPVPVLMGRAKLEEMFRKVSDPSENIER